jgi:hypothetical protein
VKSIAEKLIKFFSYNHPHLWLEINEAIFDEIEDCKKRSKEKMHRNIKALIEKLK